MKNPKRCKYITLSDGTRAQRGDKVQINGNCVNPSYRGKIITIKDFGVAFEELTWVISKTDNWYYTGILNKIK